MVHEMSISAIPPRRKYAQVIEPEETAQQFTSTDKMVFSFTGVARPITLLPALYSASYEQLFNTDPKYGHDAGAFGEKFGASMLRSASVRVLSDGILASAFHQDPRYYRIGEGSVIHRGLRSAMQALVRRGDDGAGQINFSGIGGRAAAAAHRYPLSRTQHHRRSGCKYLLHLNCDRCGRRLRSGIYPQRYP
jgi:hypothetical protein